MCYIYLTMSWLFPAACMSLGAGSTAAEFDITVVGMICTLALTVVGIVGICVAVKTLKAVKRQADIMERQTAATEIAANAAKASADALINTESAWIDGEILKNENIVTRCVLRITNHGRTTAHLISYQISSGFLTEGKVFSPDNLDSSHTQNLYALLGSDKNLDLEVFNVDDLFGNRGIHDADNKGVICVTVKYVDVVVGGRANAAPRETSFVYYYSPLVSHLERISVYNNYT